MTAIDSRPFLQVLLFAAALLIAGPATAQLAENAPAQEQDAPGILSLLPDDSVTGHEISAGGGRLAYTATAGTLALRDQRGARMAAVYYTAYTLDGAAAGQRPLTFVFNGGPGAASAYLHLGLVGPRIVEYGPRPDAATAALQDNPDSWLAFTDLVLIDPVGTGWSRAADPDKAESFWGIEQDAEALAKVIALYVAENGRTASPKVLLGESYGGFRAAKVARSLQQEQGIIVSGIVMVSPFLEGALHSGASRSALSAALLLPAIAATELDRQGRFSEEALAEAERFAMTDYLVTLAGPSPRGPDAERFYGRVAGLTGLPAEVVARTRGFVARAYLGHRRGEAPRIASPYDGTFALPDPFPESDDGHADDPILDGYLQSLGGLFVGYARERLGYETEMTYELLNRRVSGKWNWGGGRRSASAAGDLRQLLALNPGLRLLIAHGRNDLVTPYGVSRYVLDHLPAQGGADRARLEIYKGGHMFYFDPDSRAAFTAAAEAFYGAAAP
jgi:carboxypeptidase C (cathepsin A)